MVLLDAARRDVKVPRLAYWLLGVGITVTLVANVLAGVAFGVLGGVVAAWPARALVGSYELLMAIIRRSRPTMCTQHPMTLFRQWQTCPWCPFRPTPKVRQ